MEKYRHMTQKKQTIFQHKPVKSYNNIHDIPINSKFKVLKSAEEKIRALAKEKKRTRKLLAISNEINKKSQNESMEAEENTEIQNNKALPNPKGPYMHSGFSWEEINSMDSNGIKSLVSIDENIEENDKFKIEMKTITKGKGKQEDKKKSDKRKHCFNLCSERDGEDESDEIVLKCNFI